MATSPIPHHTITGDYANKYAEFKGHVYEVSPLGKVEMGTLFNELYCRKGAEIIHYIGNARGILFNNSCELKFPKTFNSKVYKGSSINIPKSIKKWKQLGR